MVCTMSACTDKDEEMNAFLRVISGWVMLSVLGNMFYLPCRCDTSSKVFICISFLEIGIMMLYKARQSTGPSTQSHSSTLSSYFLPCQRPLSDALWYPQSSSTILMMTIVSFQVPTEALSGSPTDHCGWSNLNGLRDLLPRTGVCAILRR